MLKKVVLPAPFGPMIETIDFSGMTKSTESHAVRPPKVFVTDTASRTAPFSLAVRFSACSTA